ncbi:MAG: phage replisome organizer N-terminal domain-containing protein, partial [Lachnospiraceae bacterium]|nr:phage replisome organizer N-terminal domain-containing protein [Lachnospiraceae bacterium]
MPDNRKYYYLKLKENYFEDDAIVLLESMPDGILYSNILLKLYLKSLKNGGKLEFAENIPYTSQMIATITRHQVGTVEKALQVFLQLGLVEPMENGALYMSNIELMIGQSSTEAERKRRARLALNQKKCLPDTSADKCPPYTPDKCPDICPPER